MSESRFQTNSDLGPIRFQGARDAFRSQKPDREGDRAEVAKGNTRDLSHLGTQTDQRLGEGSS